MDSDALWRFLLLGYLLTIAIETPVLLVGLSPPHTLLRRLLAGIWLTACTYPIVVLVLPLMFEDRFLYLLIAETFAPAAECALFFAAFGTRDDTRPNRLRDVAAITCANLASFAVGVVIFP